MRISTALLVGLVLVSTACANPADTTTPTTATPDTTATTPTIPTSGTTGTTPTTTATAAEGPVAPDFTLDLGSGGTFVLSEETRPVYLVFWAEW